LDRQMNGKRRKKIKGNRRRPYCLGPFQDYVLWKLSEGMSPLLAKLMFGVSGRTLGKWKDWARKHPC
jgi:hypothetical protein